MNKIFMYFSFYYLLIFKNLWYYYYGEAYGGHRNIKS